MIIGYCRKSRISETDELTRQEQLVREYCNSKGYKLDKLFSEVGSSVDPDRPQYKLMLQYLTEHEGITVVVTDYDRIGRDTLLLSLFKQLCKEHKHLVELVNGTIYSYDNYTDVFTQEILSSVSSYIYQQTKAKMYRGMLQARKEGKRIGAKPYGYDIVNKRLAVNPEQADTVRKVFMLISEGISTAEVARLLKQEGITTNTGKYFDTRAVRLMIKNEGYTGVNKAGDLYPPLISKELYLEANSNLKSLQNCGGKRTYPLSNKILCSKCNTHLIIGYKADRDAVIINSCNSSNSIRGKKTKCSCQGSKLDLVESLVMSDIKAYIECKLAELYQKLTDDKAVLAEHQKELDAVQTEIDASKEKLTRLNRLFLLGNVTEQELQEHSREYKDNIALLEEKQRRLESYSLYKVTQELQDRIVRLEELQNSVNIIDLVKLVDYVSYYKDSAGISVKTKFKESI